MPETLRKWCGICGYASSCAECNKAHPWTESLENVGLMLEGKIKIPHLANECVECARAHLKRFKYREEIVDQCRRGERPLNEEDILLKKS